MYLEHFGLNQLPFSISPDPSCVYLSEKHQESLAHLIYGVTRGGGSGFVQLTGEVGTGKTTICRLFLNQLPENIQAALILNPAVTPIELMEALFKELSISRRGITKQLNRMVERLNKHLLDNWAKGHTTVVIIDEAQNIPRDTLEHLRLLTNLETDQQKLLQIILIGQPELQTLMQRSDLRQLSQRITSRFHLEKLSKKETAEYIEHRLKQSGGSENLIPNHLMKTIYKYTEGTPRLINVLCDRILLAAYAKDEAIITKKHLYSAASEVFSLQKKQSWPVLQWTATIPVVVGIIYLIMYWPYPKQSDETQQTRKHQESVITPPPSTGKSIQLTFPDTPEAWRVLFKLWKILPNQSWYDNSCPPIEFTGMGCLRRHSSLYQIKQLNAPILLELPNRRLLPLIGIDQDIWWIWQPDGATAVSSHWLNENWPGNYYILWPTESNIWYSSDSQEKENWALKMIETITQMQPVNLEQWILQFQQENGLTPDGIIGKETQMALSLQAYDGPKIDKYVYQGNFID